MKNNNCNRSSQRILCVFFLLVAMACSKSDQNSKAENEESTTAEEMTVIQFAESVNVLSTFVNVLKEIDTELLTTISTASQKTLFIPTNDAFRKFLADLEDYESLDDFDSASEKKLLSEILTYHMVHGTAAFSDALSNGTILATLQSEELTVKVDATIYLTDKTDVSAEVQRADNAAKDGVVHIIDKVLLPQTVIDALFPQKTLFESIASNEDLELFEQAILKADMLDMLNSDGPMTVFAPTNEAIASFFELLGEDYETFDDFDNIIELQLLKELILGHLVSQRIESKDFEEGNLATMLAGDSVELVSVGDTFVIRDATALDANLISVDQKASNGILHQVDKILIPQKIKEFVS